MMLSEHVQSQRLNNSVNPQVNDNIPTEHSGKGTNALSLYRS